MAKRDATCGPADGQLAEAAALNEGEDKGGLSRPGAARDEDAPERSEQLHRPSFMLSSVRRIKPWTY